MTVRVHFISILFAAMLCKSNTFVSVACKRCLFGRQTCIRLLWIHMQLAFHKQTSQFHFWVHLPLFLCCVCLLSESSSHTFYSSNTYLRVILLSFSSSPLFPVLNYQATNLLKRLDERWNGGEEKETEKKFAYCRITICCLPISTNNSYCHRNLILQKVFIFTSREA